MTLTTRASRPAGFTLVELLVVISILAILMALVGVVYTKAIEGQRNRSTDDLANRLQPALEGEYDAIVQACARERQQGKIPAGVVAYCENDMDRAQAVWTAARLWRAFPTSFAEALATIYITTDAAGNYYVRLGSVPGGETVQYFSPPLATFAEVAALGAGQKPGDEAAILLYIILAKRASGASGGFAADDLTNGMQMDVACSSGRSGRTFRDAWGNPMSYQRWASAAPELQTAPYVNAKSAYLDPLDPIGKVVAWSNATRRGQMASALQFTGQNRLITVLSPGKDGVYDPVMAGDDLVGYRLRRLGNRGK